MNIEDLTKTQLLLLTLLVNFVTSIATGVLTVSLLDQAPPTVIQTVNRIVDHTIETVTTEVPVIRDVPVAVPSSEELLTAAIAKTSAWSVRFYRVGIEAPVGRGFYYAPSRTVFTTVGDLPGTVTVEFSDGTRAEARALNDEGPVERYLVDENVALPVVPAARLVPLSELRQGQTAIALSADRAAVTGIVSLVTPEYAKTDIPGMVLGEPVVNLSGDLIGLSIEDGYLLKTEAVTALFAP
jgi:hypothetical protein